MQLAFINIRTTLFRCTNCKCALEVIFAGRCQQFSDGLSLLLPFKNHEKSGLMLTKKVQNAAVIAFFEVDCNVGWNLVNIFQPAQFLFDLSHKAARAGPALKLFDIGVMLTSC